MTGPPINKVILSYKVMKIFAKDIEERLEFDRCGYHYVNICLDKEKKAGIWELRRDNKCYGFEVVKGKKHKNPDGSVVYAYPSDESFGKYGWYLCGRNALGRSINRLKEL